MFNFEKMHYLYHRIIHRSPYKTLFENDPKIIIGQLSSTYSIYNKELITVEIDSAETIISNLCKIGEQIVKGRQEAYKEQKKAAIKMLSVLQFLNT